MRNYQSRARRDPSGCQIVDVLVGRGYRPNVIEATAGIPIRLVFHREDVDPCSERVVFSSPRIDRRLAAAGTTTIELPGQPPGAVRFTCGRGRYRGRIEVIDGHRPSALESLRRKLTSAWSLGDPALVLAISALPPVAVLSLVDFSEIEGTALATAVLTAWVVFFRSAVRHFRPLNVGGSHAVRH
jgi:hypothetical protein